MEKYPSEQDPNDPTTIEGAIHAAVEREAERGELTEGDHFWVREIFGEVGPHDSPWHITYTALIEKTSS
jgi:hypothetical protein